MREKGGAILLSRGGKGRTAPGRAQILFITFLGILILASSFGSKRLMDSRSLSFGTNTQSRREGSSLKTLNDKLYSAGGSRLRRARESIVVVNNSATLRTGKKHEMEPKIVDGVILPPLGDEEDIEPREGEKRTVLGLHFNKHHSSSSEDGVAEEGNSRLILPEMNVKEVLHLYRKYHKGDKSLEWIKKQAEHFAKSKANEASDFEELEQKRRDRLREKRRERLERDAKLHAKLDEERKEEHEADWGDVARGEIGAGAKGKGGVAAGARIKGDVLGLDPEERKKAAAKGNLEPFEHDEAKWFSCGCNEFHLGDQRQSWCPGIQHDTIGSSHACVIKDVCLDREHKIFIRGTSMPPKSDVSTHVFKATLANTETIRMTVIFKHRKDPSGGPIKGISWDDLDNEDFYSDEDSTLVILGHSAKSHITHFLEPVGNFNMAVQTMMEGKYPSQPAEARDNTNDKDITGGGVDNEEDTTPPKSFYQRLVQKGNNHQRGGGEGGVISSSWSHRSVKDVKCDDDDLTCFHPPSHVASTKAELKPGSWQQHVLRVAMGDVDGAVWTGELRDLLIPRNLPQRSNGLRCFKKAVIPGAFYGIWPQSREGNTAGFHKDLHAYLLKLSQQTGINNEKGLIPAPRGDKPPPPRLQGIKRNVRRQPHRRAGGVDAIIPQDNNLKHHEAENLADEQGNEDGPPQERLPAWKRAAQRAVGNRQLQEYFHRHRRFSAGREKGQVARTRRPSGVAGRELEESQERYADMNEDVNQRHPRHPRRQTQRQGGGQQWNFKVDSDAGGEKREVEIGTMNRLGSVASNSTTRRTSSNGNHRVILIAHRKTKRTITDHISFSALVKSVAATVGAEVKMVQFGEHDFLSQATLAKDAGILMGIHGADLTNMLFQKRGSVVIELNPLYFFENRFFELATALHHTYLSWTCTSEECAFGGNPTRYRDYASKNRLAYDERDHSIENNGDRFQWSWTGYTGMACPECNQLSCCGPIKQGYYSTLRDSDIKIGSLDTLHGRQIEMVLHDAFLHLGWETVSEPRKLIDG